MPQIDSQTTSDTYTSACTLGPVIDSSGGFATVATADAYVEFQWGRRDQLAWTDEVHVSAGTPLMLPHGVEGVRFRSYTSGVPATVSAALFYPNEPAPEISTSSTVTVSVPQLSNLSVTRSTVQSIPNATDTTVIFDTVEGSHDPSGIFSLDTATGEVTVNAGGTFLVVTYAILPTAASGHGQVIVEETSGTFGRNVVPLTVAGDLSASGAAPVGAGYVIYSVVHQDSGGALNLSFARMEIAQVS